MAENFHMIVMKFAFNVILPQSISFETLEEKVPITNIHYKFIYVK